MKINAASCVARFSQAIGRSENREYLRRHFEVNAESIAGAALSRLARDGKFDAAVFRPSESKWYISRSGSPGTTTILQFGIPTDIPVPNAYVR